MCCENLFYERYESVYKEKETRETKLKNKKLGSIDFFSLQKLQKVCMQSLMKTQMEHSRFPHDRLLPLDIFSSSFLWGSL